MVAVGTDPVLQPGRGVTEVRGTIASPGRARSPEEAAKVAAENRLEVPVPRSRKLFNFKVFYLD